MLLIYRYLSIFLLPIIFILLLFRVCKGKEDKGRFLEKVSLTMHKRPRGDIIWFNAASVGELKLLLPLLQRLEAEGRQLLITTTTITSARYFTSLKLRAIHQFAPLDVAPIVIRFLHHWRPKLLLLTESELWPNLLHYTAKRCPIMLINARLSNSSFKRWSKLESVAKQMLSNIKLIIPSSQLDLEKYANFSNNIADFHGNMKYLAEPLAINSKELASFQAQTENQSIICYASTHEGEEEIFLELHKELMVNKPNLLSIIVPRHPQRSKEVLRYAKQLHLNAQLYSEEQDQLQHAQVYIVDKIGVLGLFFQLAPIVVMGKSFTAMGGHNMLEPAQLDCAVVTGINYQNFTNIVEDFLLNDAIVVAQNWMHLKEILIGLLNDPLHVKQLQANAKYMMEQQNDLLDKIMLEISKWL